MLIDMAVLREASNFMNRAAIITFLGAVWFGAFIAAGTAAKVKRLVTAAAGKSLLVRGLGGVR
jgi:hypothetical protein